MILTTKCKASFSFNSAVVVMKIRIKNSCLRNYQTAFQFDYERAKGTENAKWLKLTGKQSMEKFIPLTRKTLLKTILEDKEMISVGRLDGFQKLATGIDSLLYMNYKKKLDAIKSLYNPLSPDRDTMQMKSFSTDELKAREKEILHGLEELLGEASFYKLPHSVMLDAIGEKNVAEKMVVKVSPENYATLQFWVIGMDVVPFDDRPWYVIAEERARSYKNRTFRQLDPLSKYNFRRSFVAQIRSQLWKKLFGESVRRIARYKRVIVAVRRKEDLKLLIKGFKDIPCENLEFLLPDGKLKMGKLDKIRLFVQSSLIITFVLATTATNLIDLKLETSLVFAISSVLILARNIAFYKRMRNRHVLDISQTLYFKSVASNHALLALIIDRAEDEIYKLSLLIYAILHQIKSTPALGKRFPNGLTDNQLKELIEDWLREKFDIHANLNVQKTLNYMEEWKIVEKVITKEKVNYFAIDLNEALDALPHLKRPPLLHQADLLNINTEREIGDESEENPAYLSYDRRYSWQ
ncbi:transmembrane protein 143-like isoform X1 [Rhopilema esculentum]|uniref:transmembrane protein 143-like isoform X1 n=1 Tax=Rhopilema esculentum TaxID=499914 RepID=UPI0031E41F42